jgi:hypothetical protein
MPAWFAGDCMRELSLGKERGMLRAFEVALSRAGGRHATRWVIIPLLALAAVILPYGGKGLTAAWAVSQASASCRGVTLAVIPAQGVIASADGSEGGHLWWRTESGGTCVGTVIEDVQLSAAVPARTLRVIVFTAADPGGLTVAKQQVTGSGAVSRAFGIHQVFRGLTQVCLIATSSLVPSPDMPCAVFGQPAPAQQFTQPPTGASAQPPGLGPPPGWQLPPWWPWPGAAGASSS